MTTGGDHLLPVRTRRRLLTRIPPVQPPTEPARSPGDYGVAEPDELRLEAGAASRTCSTSPSTAGSHGVASARGFDGYSDDHGQVVLSDRRARSPVAHRRELTTQSTWTGCGQGTARGITSGLNHPEAAYQWAREASAVVPSASTMERLPYSGHGGHPVLDLAIMLDHPRAHAAGSAAR